MSNEKTILPNSVLVSLYKDTLVLPDLAQKKAEIIIHPLDATVAQAPANKLTTATNIDAQANTQVTNIDAPSANMNVEIETKKDANINATISSINDLGQIKYLGEHLKQVTIIVKDELAVYLNENDLTLLSSILSACKLTLADIALINVAQQKLSLHEILNVLPSKLVMIFDVTSTTLKIKLPTTLYKSIQLGDTYLLFSNSLSLMQGGDQSAKLEKGKLWAILKSLFQL